VVAELQLRGVYVPLVTPFDRRGDVDLDALEHLTDEVLSAGAARVIALATTGEPTSLDDAERDAVVAACSRVCTDRGAGLIVGAGTNDTRTTLARHEALANAPGVVASLAVVPYYVRPTEAAIVAHFQLVAARSPVPLVTYNVPYRTGQGLTAASLLELASTDNIAGVKQAVGDIDADTPTVPARAPEGFAVLAGDDPYLFPMTLMGAPGAIAASANLYTRRFVTMIEHGLAGEVTPGRALAEALLPLVRALFAEPSPAVIKALLQAEGRIPTADVRMPLSNASATAVKHALAVRPV
jgi:4-hydroxy-tetrahydrodipicolinate synthase